MNQPKRKRKAHRTLKLTGDMKIARSREALKVSTIAEIESVRRECYAYLATTESYIRRRIQNGEH